MKYENPIIGDVNSSEIPSEEPFEFKNEAAKETWKTEWSRQTDGYSRAVYVFAARWARFAENRISEAQGELTGTQWRQLMDKAINQACSTDGCDITSAMYARAREVLYRLWRWGDWTL